MNTASVTNTGIIKIHGREYSTVALRVQRFRESHQDWTLCTKIIERTEEVVVFRAEILDEQGRLRATGHSEEYRHRSQINQTSALENAETSAIGRALAALGLGGTELASADELANALNQQKQNETKLPALDPAIVAKFEAAEDRPGVAAAWNNLPKDKRSLYHQLKETALARIAMAPAA